MGQIIIKMFRLSDKCVVDYIYYMFHARYTVNWLKRDSQLPLIEGIVGRAQQRVLGRDPALRDTSITSEGLWLPVAPDRR